MYMKKIVSFFLLFVLIIAAFSCGGEKGGSDNLPEPQISGITTNYEGKAVVGEPVQINGANFSPVASDNKVVYGVGLNATKIDVTEASESRLVFIAPEVSGNQLKIRVSTKGKESNSVILEYTTKPKDEEPWDDTPTIQLEGATTVKICEGVEWTTFHGTWDGKIRNINIIRSKLNEHNKLGMYFNYSEEGLKDLDEKCVFLDAIAGTNGPMACCQFARVDGVIKHAATNTETEPWISNCAITIDGDVVDIVKVKDNYDAAALKNNTVGCAGPLLVWEGEILKSSDEWKAADKNNWLTSTHPRTAIGISKDGKTVVQVTVDGRWHTNGWPSEQTAYGMSTDRLAKLMRGLGCYKAMNFDGGGGTAMWVYGQGNSRNIVNHVSENRVDASKPETWDWNGTILRPTGNAVYIKSDLK